MNGLAVYVKEGLSFAQDLSLAGLKLSQWELRIAVSFPKFTVKIVIL